MSFLKRTKKKVIARIATIREFAIGRRTVGNIGLSKLEITEVLGLLRAAVSKGTLPTLSYRYNPHPRLLGKDPLYATPRSKRTDYKRTAVKVRALLKQKFGNKYIVYLV